MHGDGVNKIADIKSLHLWLFGIFSGNGFYKWRLAHDGKQRSLSGKKTI